MTGLAGADISGFGAGVAGRGQSERKKERERGFCSLQKIRFMNYEQGKLQ